MKSTPRVSAWGLTRPCLGQHINLLKNTQERRYFLPVVKAKILYSSVQQPEEKQGNLWLGFPDNLIFTPGAFLSLGNRALFRISRRQKPALILSPSWLVLPRQGQGPGQAHDPASSQAPHTPWHPHPECPRAWDPTSALSSWLTPLCPERDNASPSSPS